MSSSIFGIGISGMNAAQAGLTTTGHNISNAFTPGFSRQQVVQASSQPQFTGAGFIGQGVSVSTVKRIYSDTLTGQLTQAQAQGSQLEAYDARIKELSNLLGSASAGLAPAMQDFFGGVADLASHAESASSRDALLSSANALAARFQGVDQQLTQMRSSINADITSSVQTINSYAQQIASLNRSIVLTESAGTMQPANDLRDQRDTLVAALNREVRATVVKGNTGGYDVFVGNGQPVVVGGNPVSLLAVPSAEDPQRLDVGYQSGASIVRLAASHVQGGTLGGLINFRDTSLDGAQNALGRVATGLAQSFNGQHALGQDLYGALGTPFFSVASPTVMPGSSNAGTAAVAAALQNADALTTSDYRLRYNGNAGGNENFQLTRIADGTNSSIAFPAASGYPFTINTDGVSIVIPAGAVLHDSWVIQPTRAGATQFGVVLKDPATIAAASPVRTIAALSNSGNATISAGGVSSAASLPLAMAVTLIFNAASGEFAVSGAVPAVAPIAYAAGAGISINGVDFSISGTPSNGDVFSLERNANARADNRNALALGALQLSNALGRNSGVAGSQPSMSFQGAYGQMVSQIGNAARQSGVMLRAQQNLVAQTRQEQQSVSGVNLDEEAANLLRYQQAYQASGKMMQIASTLFQSVLELGR